MTTERSPQEILDPPDDVIIDSLPLALLALDEGCRLIRFNRPAERLTGHYRSKVLGCHCDAILAPDPCGPECPIKRVMQSGNEGRPETMSLRTADQRQIAVEIVGSPLLGPRGRVIGAVVLLGALPTAVDEPEPPATIPWSAQKARHERESILEALAQAEGNITLAAKALSMHRTTLWRKIKRLGINP